MALIVGGMQHLIPGVKVVSWLQDARIRLGHDDFTQRKTRWVRLIVLHTTMGMSGGLKSGAGPSDGARYVIKYQQDTKHIHAGEHLIVDCDGTVYQPCDLRDEAAYHATSVNDVSIGIELKQDGAGNLYETQMQVLVTVLDWLTDHFGIQRQFQHPYHGEDHPVPRLVSGGRDVVGIVGHRDQTGMRGAGDPGIHPYTAMIGAGYEAFDFSTGQDLEEWRSRQTMLGMSGVDVDGIPGPKTVLALQRAGHKGGLWVQR
jgi:hypothetical protein